MRIGWPLSHQAVANLVGSPAVALEKVDKLRKIARIGRRNYVRLGAIVEV